MAWKDLEIQKQIGEGSFGKVFLAKWRETTVAVKLLTYTGVSGSLEDNDEFVAQGMNVLLKGLEQVAMLFDCQTLCDCQEAIVNQDHRPALPSHFAWLMMLVPH